MNRSIPLTPVQRTSSRFQDLEEEAADYSKIFKCKTRKLIRFYCFLTRIII